MLRVIEAFSGMGGQRKALENIRVSYEVVNIIEWDIGAILAYDYMKNGMQDISKYNALTKKELEDKLFELNLSLDGKRKVSRNSLKRYNAEFLAKVLCAYERTSNLGDITKVTGKVLPTDIDILTYSFPCQNLSISSTWTRNWTGIARGTSNRSGLLWEIERILLDIKSTGKKLPTVLLMENVSTILAKKNIENFKEWQGVLEKLGYYNVVYTLNAKDFGVPQTRRRTFMISTLCENVSMKNKIKQFLHSNNLEEIYKAHPKPLKGLEHYLKTNYRIKKYKEEADKSNPNNTKTRQKIYALNKVIFSDKKGFADTVGTLTTKQDRHPNAGILTYHTARPGKAPYRTLTPRECFLLMGFAEHDYEKIVNNNPLYCTNKTFFTRERLEKLAGNSLVVDVLEEIFKQIIEIIKIKRGDEKIWM